MFSLKPLKPILYFLCRLLVSLLAAHFIVVQSATETITVLFTKGYYYYSVCCSLVIALILVEFVYFVTKKLNQQHKNEALTNERITEQFVSGFLTTSLIAFLLAMLLYWINGENIFNSSYFTKLYALILLFIFSVNMAYLLFYYKNAIKSRYYLFNANSLDIPNENSTLPAIIFYEDKACFAIDFKGIKTVWPINIEQSRKKLNENTYFQINRQTIIHRAIIRSIKPFNLRHIKIESLVTCPIELITSRRMTVLFKAWVSKK
ncbi:hypothetical protein WG904_08155 [Pedobacter sp. Du54]|uniref:hypothetical protein n=1 Tax=Pedobacter anseongensis TaxID=3133439 RepID=UPI0030B45731